MSRPDLTIGLPEREHGALGILNNGHAAGFHDVEWRGNHLAAECGSFGRGLIRVCDGEVGIPVRGQARLGWTRIGKSGNVQPNMPV